MQREYFATENGSHRKNEVEVSNFLRQREAIKSINEKFQLELNHKKIFKFDSILKKDKEFFSFNCLQTDKIVLLGNISSKDINCKAEIDLFCLRPEKKHVVDVQLYMINDHNEIKLPPVKVCKLKLNLIVLKPKYTLQIVAISWGDSQQIPVKAEDDLMLSVSVGKSMKVRNKLTAENGKLKPEEETCLSYDLATKKQSQLEIKVLKKLKEKDFEIIFNREVKLSFLEDKTTQYREKQFVLIYHNKTSFQ